MGPGSNLFFNLYGTIADILLSSSSLKQQMLYMPELDGYRSVFKIISIHVLGPLYLFNEKT